MCEFSDLGLSLPLSIADAKNHSDHFRVSAWAVEQLAFLKGM